MALYAHGGLLYALESSWVHRVSHADSSVDLTTLGQVAHGQPGMRCNDRRCDRNGVFWMGSMVMNMHWPCLLV
jgi:sugar lactone lactonase YvrE